MKPDSDSRWNSGTTSQAPFDGAEPMGVEKLEYSFGFCSSSLRLMIHRVSIEKLRDRPAIGLDADDILLEVPAGRRQEASIRLTEPQDTARAVRDIGDTLDHADRRDRDTRRTSTPY